MKKFGFGALLFAVSAIPLCHSAQAGTYVVEETQSRYIQCYSRVYVPAKIQVNTRGRLVRGESKGFEVSGESWNYVRNAPTYIQTRRTVESDHYTLVGSGCP